jgi:hypothetical protein
MPRVLRIHIPRWLKHVNLLIKNTVQERILNIKPLHTPTIGHRQSEKNMNGSMFNHGTKRIIIVNTCMLLESLSHQTGLIAFNQTISFILQLVDPLAINDIEARSEGHQMPGAVTVHSSNLIIHCMFP